MSEKIEIFSMAVSLTVAPKRTDRNTGPISNMMKNSFNRYKNIITIHDTLSVMK
jgi:hypothetical protein